MKSLIKVSHRYMYTWIFIFLMINTILFIYFNRSQLINSQLKNDQSITNLNRKVAMLVDEANKELKTQNEFVNAVLELMKARLHQKTPSINQDRLLDLNKNLKNAEKIVTKMAEKKVQQSVVNESRINNCPVEVSIPVLILTCNRPDGLERTLSQLLRLRRELPYDRVSEASLQPEQALVRNSTPAFAAARFPIYISQGCQHGPTQRLVERYRSELKDTLLYKQKNEPLLRMLKNKRMLGYFKISDHYKVALDWVMRVSNQSGVATPEPPTARPGHSDSLVLIIEDDLDLAPDFLTYFHALSTLLLQDESLFCVSAWNDNGKADLIDPSQHATLYRTDFFPGLGWMMRRSFWLEIRANWPVSFWDEYLREPKVRKLRQCIRPEIPRTATFGRKGVSNGQFFDKHLKFLLLNRRQVDFCRLPLTTLASEAQYRAQFQNTVYGPTTRLMTLPQFTAFGDQPLPTLHVRLEYFSNKEFTKMAKTLSLMEDVKSGVPRTAYRGVVTFFHRSSRVFLAPPSSWTGYKSS